MRMMKKIVIAVVVSVALFATTSLGAEKGKIGIVDFQKILENSVAGKAAQEEINAEGKKMEADLKSKGEEIKALEKKLEREEMVLSKDARDERQREARIKINDFKSLQAKYRNDIKKLEAQALRQIQDDVFDLVKQIAEDGGYLLVLEKRAGGVVYFKEGMEITDLVIEKFDQKSTTESKESKTKE